MKLKRGSTAASGRDVQSTALAWTVNVHNGDKGVYSKGGWTAGLTSTEWWLGSVGAMELDIGSIDLEAKGELRRGKGAIIVIEKFRDDDDGKLT
eukprot:scaffold17647_cov68-Cyclotella_meneghiniana.AAC.2